MALGYDGKLYILAFDHRGSFQKKMFGIEGDPPRPKRPRSIIDARELMTRRRERAVRQARHPQDAGVLVDEQFGGTIPEASKAAGRPDDAGREVGRQRVPVRVRRRLPRPHREVRPARHQGARPVQPGRRRRDERASDRASEGNVADWLHANGKKFLFELLVPAEPAQLESVGGDTDRYDAELRPVMRRVIEHFQNEGVEVDIWKIEGVDTQEDAQLLSDQARKGEGRENVKSVLLGRGASDDKVDQWLQAAAPVEGFIGFAIGRSIWWNPLKAYLDGGDREEQSQKIADNYLRFVKVYDEASSSVSA